MEMKKIATEKFIISRNDAFMEGWPDMIKTQSGKLICVYNECVSHPNRDHTWIAMRHSIDNGKTWSEPRHIDVETMHGNHWNSIRISQIGSGRIFLICDRVEEDERTNKTQMVFWTSDDDGVTWSDAWRPGIYGFCSDKVRELKDGSLLMLISVHNHENEKCDIFAHKSYDGGKTWTDRILVASSDEYYLIEPAAMEMSDGTLVAFIRENSHTNKDCMRSISKDGGLTWDGIYPFAIPCCHRPVVNRLSNGNILLTYRHQESGVKRITGGAVFSEETAIDKARGDGKVSLYELDYDNNPDSADGGYTAWLEYEEGKIVMANYITDDAEKPYIRGYYFDLVDLK